MSDTALTFSVVIPVYNRTDLLRRSISSALVQTCQDFELIVVDDGSTTDIGAVVRCFNDPRIIYIRQPNQGASAARNRGIDAARGTYIAFLDSDDLYLPNHLERAKSALAGRKDTVFYVPVIAERAEGVSVVKPPRALRPGETMACYLMCDRGFVQTSGLIVPRGLAQGVRYRKDAVYGDDTDFAVRLQLSGCAFVMAETPSVIWSDGDSLPRLSIAGAGTATLNWLEDLRQCIPVAAYKGYRGWHVAKAMFRKHPFLALKLYLGALLSRSYSFRLAMIVFCQIVFPASLYRDLANAVIKLRGLAQKQLYKPSDRD